MGEPGSPPARACCVHAVYLLHAPGVAGLDTSLMREHQLGLAQVDDRVRARVRHHAVIGRSPGAYLDLGRAARHRSDLADGVFEEHPAALGGKQRKKRKC